MKPAILRMGWTFLIFALTIEVAGAGPAAGKSGSDAAHMEIDILPGEVRNLVDPGGPDTVTVAVLGSATLDVRSIRPESLRLGGAPIVKDATGATHSVRDVNGDGRLDLIVQFAAGQIQLSDADTSAVLEGTTVGGALLRGRDAIQTVAAALGAGADPGPTSGRVAAEATAAGSAVDLGRNSEEKLPPIQVSIRLLDGTPAKGILPLAILAGETFDPATLSLGSIRVQELPITKMTDGELASVKDVDGDGRDDLVVAVPSATLRGTRVSLSAVTEKGRIVTGEAVMDIEGPEPPDASTSSGASSSQMSNPGDPMPDARYPYVIFINDNAPAQQYPATVTLSGVQIGRAHV